MYEDQQIDSQQAQEEDGVLRHGIQLPSQHIEPHITDIAYIDLDGPTLQLDYSVQGDKQMLRS